MARAYGERHGCAGIANAAISHAEKFGPLAADAVFPHPTYAVVSAILRGEVVLPPDGPRDCYPAKNFEALRDFIERGEVDGGE